MWRQRYEVTACDSHCGDSRFQKTHITTAHGAVTPTEHQYPQGLGVWFLAHDLFVRTNCCSVAKMFVRLSLTGVHCDHTVHVSSDLSLWFDSPMFWPP